MNISNLTRKVFDDFFKGIYKIPLKYLNSKEKRKEFMVENFNYAGSYVLKLMLSNSFLWSDYTVEDWKDVMSKGVENEIGLYTYIIFLHKYLNIDGKKIYFMIPDDQRSRSTDMKILDYLHSPEMFKIDPREWQDLEKYNIDLDKLKSHHEFLHNNGADTYFG